ncbi:MAG: hypothetical protein ACE366_28760 [Bradymonadia bacterium]
MQDIIETFQKQLADDPQNIDAFNTLEASLIQEGAYETLVEAYALQAEHLDEDEALGLWQRCAETLEHQGGLVDDPVQGASLAFLVGQVLELKLGELEQAMLRYQRAFKLDPNQVGALAAARAIYQMQENWEMVLRLYSIQVEATGDSDAQASLYFEMAEICLSLGATDDAVLCVRQAFKLAPEHPRAGEFAELIDHARSEGQAKVQALLEQVEGIRDTRRKSAMILEAVEVLLREYPEDERIEGLLRGVLERQPRNDQARILLEHYFEENGRYEDLLKFLEEQLAKTTRKADRLALLQRMVTISREALQDLPRAAQWSRALLKVDPAHQDAFNFCVDYYSEKESWHELVAVYEAALRSRGRGHDEGAMLVQIAMILWRKVGDLKAAEGYFKRIKLNDPRNGLMLDFYTQFYSEAGDHKRLLATLGARQSAAESLAKKLEIGRQMADVAENALNSPDKAIDVWKGIRKLDPDNGEARDALRRLFERTRKWNALLESLKEDYNLLPEDDVEGRVGILSQMITIYRDRLHLEVMVVNTYNQILLLQPGNTEALDALESTFEKKRRWNDLIGVLSRRADLAAEVGETDAQVALLRRIAQLWLDQFSNPQQAIVYLEALLAVKPRDEEAISSLIELYTRRKMWPKVYEAYGLQLELLEGDARVARLQQMATLATERLKREGEAIDLWRQVLAAQPDHGEAWEALEILYRKTLQWGPLADLLTERIGLTESDEDRLLWLKKLAPICADQLGDEARATEAWRAVLRLNVQDRQAEAFLRGVYLQAQDWRSLEGLFAERGELTGFVRLLDEQVRAADEQPLKVDLLKRMARVQKVELGDEGAALGTWARVFEVQADDLEAAITLSPHYEQTAQWDELVDTLEVQLDHEHGDPQTLMQTLAEIHEHKREDLPAAYMWRANALQRQPEDAACLSEAIRIAEAGEQWGPLTDLLGVLVRSVQTPEVEVEMHRALAHMNAGPLNEPAQAVAHYERVRELSGDSPEVLGALAGLYQGLGASEELLGIYTAQLDAAEGDATAQVEILTAIGGLHENVREDAAAAQAAYTGILALEPSHLDAIQGLQRLSAVAGEQEALVGYLEQELALTEAAPRRAELLMRLGGLCEETGHGDHAIGRYGEVLAIEGTHAGAIEALAAHLNGPLSADAAEVLEPHLRAAGDAFGLHRVLSLLVDAEGEGSFEEKRRARLAELAALRRDALADHDGAFEAYARLLNFDPSDEEVRGELEAIAAAHRLWAQLVEVYQTFAVAGDQVTLSGEQAPAYSRRVALLQEERLSDVQGARLTLETLAGAEGDTLEVLEILDRLNTRLEDWRGLVGVCERKVACLEGEAQIPVLFRVADLWEEVLEDPEAAVVALRRILDIDPRQGRALNALERIFRNTGRHADLAGLLRRRLEITDAAEETQARVELLYQLAQVLEHQLGDLEGALVCYGEVFTLDTEHRPSLEAVEHMLAHLQGDTEHADGPQLRAHVCDLLSPIYTQREAWALCIHLAEVRLSDAETPADRVALRSRIAELKEHRLHDQPGALVVYSEAFEDDYGNPQVLAELQRLAAMTEGWPALVQVLRGPLDVEGCDIEAEVQRSMLALISVLYDRRLDEANEAIAALVRLLDLFPEDTEALARLDALYFKVGDADALAEILERRVVLEAEEDPRVALLVRLAQVYESELEAPRQAIKAWSQIRALRPEGLDAHVALERLFTAVEDHRALVEVLLDHGARAEAVEDRKALLFKAAALLEQPLEERDDAVSVYRDILELDAEDTRALGELDRLFSELERHEALLEILTRELGLAEGDDGRNAFELRMGRLLWGPLGQPEEALACFNHIVARTPDHGGARDGLESLLEAPEVRLAACRSLEPIYTAAGHHLALRDTLRLTLADRPEEEQIPTLLQIAILEEEALEQPVSAFETLSEAYTSSGGRADIREGLERLAGTTDSYGELADLLSEISMTDETEAVTVHLKIAEIAHTHLDDVNRAIEEYRQVLALVEGEPRALDALEVLYDQVGDDVALVQILAEKAERTAEAESRRSLRARRAGIWETRLGDLPEAIDTWRSVLADDRHDVGAFTELERLLSLSERWPELTQLYEARLGDVTEDPARADLEFKLGEAWERHLGEGEKALGIYKGILDRMSAHEAARGALEALFGEEDRAAQAGISTLSAGLILEPHYRRDEQFAALVLVLEARQRDPEVETEARVTLLREIAEIHSGRLGDDAAAFGACIRAFPLAPALEANRAEATRLAQAALTLDRLVNAYHDVIGEIADPALKVVLYLELGHIEEQIRGLDEAARDCYRAVLEIEPGHQKAIELLVALYTRTEAFEDLVALYLNRAEAEEAVEDQKSLLFKAAGLLDETLGDVDRALGALRRVREIEPGNVPAFDDVERLLTREARWAEQAELISAQIDHADEAATRAGLRTRLGDVLNLRLGDQAGAIEAWHTVIVEDDPQHAVALESLEQMLETLSDDPPMPLQDHVARLLEPIYADQDRWQDWIIVLEVQLRFVSEPWGRVEILSRMAKAQEERLADKVAAFDAWRRAFAEDYGNPDLQAPLDRIAGEIEAWQPLVEAYLGGIESFGDLEAAAEILHKVAGVYETRLGADEPAVECYRRVLLIDDSRMSALDALEGIYTRHHDHEGLVEILGRKAEIVSETPAKIALLERMAHLHTAELDRPSEAIDTWRRVLDEDPEHVQALDALAALYTHIEDWDQLTNALREKLEVAPLDDEGRRQLQYRIADLCEVRLEDVDEAIFTWRSVREAAPRDERAIESLKRLYRAETRWGELIDLLEGERAHCVESDPESTALDVLDLAIGEVLRAHLGQIAQAIEMYGELLDRRPDDAETTPQAVEALEGLLDDYDHRLQASRVLERHYSAVEAHEALARILELQLEETQERAERLTLFCRLARIHRDHLGDAQGAFDFFGLAFQEDPTEAEVVQALDTLGAELQAFDRVAELYAGQAAAVLDATVSQALSRKLALIYEQELSEPIQAIDAWRAVLRADPYDAEALKALDALYLGQQDWPALIEILRSRIELAEEGEMVELRFRLGYLLEAVEGDLAGALTLYRQVLWDQADHRYALEAMERLAVNLEHREAVAEVLDPIYREAELWEKVAILTEMRVELADDARDRATLWGQIAQIREGNLTDTEGAFQAQRLAFVEDPEDEDVRGEFLRLGAELKAWSSMIEAIEHAQDAINDVDLRLEDQIRMAQWCRDEIGDLGEAVRHYQVALDYDGENDDALTALEALYTEAESWSALAEVHRVRAASLFDLDEKKARLLKLGALCAEALEDLDGAVSAYEEILDIDDADADALGALEGLFEGHGRHSDLVGILERRVDVTMDSEELIGLHRRIGVLCRDALDDIERAADAFERALDHDAGDAESLAALTQLYTQLASWDRLQDVYVKEMTAAEDESKRFDVLMAMGDNAEERLQRRDDAMEYYRQALAQRSDHQGAFEKLTGLYRQSDRWYDLVDTLNEHLDAIRDQGDQDRVLKLHLEMAEVCELHLHDMGRAVEHLNAVLAVDDHHPGALNRLASLHETSGEWAACAEVLEKAIEHAPEGPDRAESWRRLGLLRLDQLDDVEGGKAALQKAVDEASDVVAIDRLIQLATGAHEDGSDDTAALIELNTLKLAALEGEARVPALLTLGALCKGTGDHGAALGHLEAAYGLQSNDLQVADQLIEAYLDADRGDDAEPVIRGIIDDLKSRRRFKALFKYNFHLGRIYEARGDQEAALEAYTACFEYDATYLPNLSRLGHIYVDRAEWPRALKIFQTMLLHQMKMKTPAEKVDVFYNLGVIREQMGDARKARDMYNRALGFDPAHEESKAALARL